MAMAPFAPFLSEYIHREISALGENLEESVHLCSYPIANEELIDPILEDAVDRMQQIILLGRQKRNKVQIKNCLYLLMLPHLYCKLFYTLE